MTLMARDHALVCLPCYSLLTLDVARKSMWRNS